jgi:hypothetical protein
MEEHENREEELENQLHRQYAENENSRAGIFTSFIIGIVALFGFYGYVFVNTEENNRGCWNFNMQEFLLMSFIVIGILFFLATLALYLGYSLRRDHLVVYNIRMKRYNFDEKKMGEIFGESYIPSKKCCSDFILDFYNLFYWLFFCSEIFIHITTIIKICNIKHAGIPFCEYEHILYPVMLLHLVFIISTLKFRRCYYKKYKKLEEGHEKCRRQKVAVNAAVK